jgi:hypothetical protein
MHIRVALTRFGSRWRVLIIQDHHDFLSCFGFVPSRFKSSVFRFSLNRGQLPALDLSNGQTSALSAVDERSAKRVRLDGAEMKQRDDDYSMPFADELFEWNCCDELIFKRQGKAPMRPLFNTVWSNSDQSHRKTRSFSSIPISSTWDLQARNTLLDEFHGMLKEHFISNDSQQADSLIVHSQGRLYEMKSIHQEKPCLEFSRIFLHETVKCLREGIQVITNAVWLARPKNEKNHRVTWHGTWRHTFWDE